LRSRSSSDAWKLRDGGSAGWPAQCSWLPAPSGSGVQLAFAAAAARYGLFPCAPSSKRSRARGRRSPSATLEAAPLAPLVVMIGTAPLIARQIDRVGWSSLLAKRPDHSARDLRAHPSALPWIGAGAAPSFAWSALRQSGGRAGACFLPLAQELSSLRLAALPAPTISSACSLMGLCWAGRATRAARPRVLGGAAAWAWFSALFPFARAGRARLRLDVLPLQEGQAVVVEAHHHARAVVISTWDRSESGFIRSDADRAAQAPSAEAWICS